MAGGNRRQLMKEKLAGINSIVEALKAQRKIDRILVQENRQEGKRMAELLRLARKKGIYVQVVEKSRLDKLYTASNHQGIIALVDAYRYSSLEEVLENAALKNEDPFLVILDGIEDPRMCCSIILGPGIFVSWKTLLKEQPIMYGREKLNWNTFPAIYCRLRMNLKPIPLIELCWMTWIEKLLLIPCVRPKVTRVPLPVC
jgi:hypothetical protein